MDVSYSSPKPFWTPPARNHRRHETWCNFCELNRIPVLESFGDSSDRESSSYSQPLEFNKELPRLWKERLNTPTMHWLNTTVMTMTRKANKMLNRESMAQKGMRFPQLVTELNSDIEVPPPNINSASFAYMIKARAATTLTTTAATILTTTTATILTTTTATTLTTTTTTILTTTTATILTTKTTTILTTTTSIRNNIDNNSSNNIDNNSSNNINNNNSNNIDNNKSNNTDNNSSNNIDNNSSDTVSTAKYRHITPKTSTSHIMKTNNNNYYYNSDNNTGNTMKP
ncbi:hypothetical protein ElyMa_004596200 [Elysia marginata]|uniref:Uncharacterized protein n=1 Tax=Elysia marginata TaxID=1093978 RepID=A0AAV4HVQ6_9GAST|nr:hypothetical protein ElyMa_004596200 [Elysia marginata]